MQIINKKDDFKTWIEKTNLISEEQGDLNGLSTINKSSVVAAANEALNNVNLGITEIKQDNAPVLGGTLQGQNHDITGTADIILQGSYQGGLADGVTTPLMPSGSLTLSPASTEYVDLVTPAVSAIPLSGDLSGLPAAATINGNTVGMLELDSTVGHNVFYDRFFLGTDGNGQLKFINNIDLGAYGGGDLSGDINNLNILENTVGITELSMMDGSDGHTITTDGAATCTFKPIVTFSTITPNVGDDTFLINYNIGKIVVFYNGIKLVKDQDFTATDGNQVVFATPVATANSTIEFQRYGV